MCKLSWRHRGREVLRLPENVYGFIYGLEYHDGTKYIGSKTVWTEQRKKPLKGMRSNAVRKVLTESKWREYESSSKLIGDRRLVKKVILHLCSNKRTLTYLETKEILGRGCLESDEYLNENALGKFYGNCLDGLIKDEV